MEHFRATFVNVLCLQDTAALALQDLVLQESRGFQPDLVRERMDDMLLPTRMVSTPHRPEWLCLCRSTHPYSPFGAPAIWLPIARAQCSWHPCGAFHGLSQ